MFCSQSGNNTSQYETEECGVNVYKDFDMGLHRIACGSERIKGT